MNPCKKLNNKPLKKASSMIGASITMTKNLPTFVEITGGNAKLNRPNTFKKIKPTPKPIARSTSPLILSIPISLPKQSTSLVTIQRKKSHCSKYDGCGLELFGVHPNKENQEDSNT